MKIAVSGGTGFIGGHLVPYFIRHGHEMILISRSSFGGTRSGVRNANWEQLDSDPELFEGIDAIVNLAGESINQRWKASAKEAILQSRLVAADRIAKLVLRLNQKPKVVVNASGMSIYGTSETETFDEGSPHRLVDFLSNVVEEWEKAADRIQGVRLVKVRVGVVLGNDGGAFPKMALPYKLGVGGKAGSGRQWISWVHIDDMVRLIDACIGNEDISGPVNATAPHPVTNAQFGQALASSLHRPNLFPVPAFVMKLLFGELSTLLLDGQRVLPRVLLEHGFEFKYPTIESAMQDLTK